MYMNGTHQDTHQDTSRYIKIHQDTYRIGNYTKSYRKLHVTPSTRTFLAHHRAAISAAVVLADATTISLAAPAMPHELQAHHGHVALLNRHRAGPALVCEVLV